MKVAFITEGGSVYGMGHITRCLSLFTAFQEQNIDSLFIINGDAELKNIPHKTYDWNKNTSLLVNDISDRDIVILDSLHATAEAIDAITSNARLPVFIDDYRRLTYKRGVVIDWTPFVEKKYSVSINPQCHYLLGCNYISLRKPFWNIADKKINKTVSEILVTMGGGDIRNLCPLILTLLLKHTGNDIVKTVAVGQSFSTDTVNQLKEIASQHSCVNLVFSPDENKMPQLFFNADIVISAGGQTLYELARVGTPTIAVLIIDNQQDDIRGWKDAGFIDFAGSWEDEGLQQEIIKLLNKLIDNSDLRQRKSNIGKSHVDGMGTKRIVEQLLLQLDKI